MNRLLPTLLCLLSPFTCVAEDWPCWRGPRGDGSSLERNLPHTWGERENVDWKVPIPGKGHSSPVVHGSNVFVVTAMNDSLERVLLCIDLHSGRTLWQRTVLKAPLERIHRLNSHASSTPCVDGERVYVSFLDEDRMYIAAYNLEGERLWHKRPGVFSSRHGYCASPILWGDKLIVNGDHDGEAYIVALDRATGDTVWKTARPNKTRSYCTPIIRRIDGRNQLILSGSLCVASYDPDSGEQHWIIDGPTEQFVASLVYNGDLLFMTCGYPDRHMLAIRPDGRGNVTDTHVAWRTIKGASYVPSPVAVGDYFVVVSDTGFASCFEAATGERHWIERVEPHHSASLFTVDGLVFMPADNGVTSVVRPGPTFEVVARNKLEDRIFASFAAASGRLLIRGDRHLYCLEK